MRGADFADYIEQTNNASTPQIAFQYLEQSLKAIGIDKVLYSLMTDFPDLEQVAGHGIFQNYPSDWMIYYREKNYENVDPVRQYLMRSNQAFLWDTLCQKMPMSKNQSNLMNEAREAGLVSGVGLGIHCPNGGVVGMGFACNEKVEFSPTQLGLIQAYAQQFHHIYTSLNQKTENEFIILTDRQKTILSWIAEGKSAWDIGKIMNISERTVRQHRDAIYKKLDSDNKVMAITKAIRLHLIAPYNVQI